MQNNALGKNLHEFREMGSLSQEQLGRKLGLTVSTVCDWEKRRSEPSISQLKNLSAVFGVSVDFLIGNAEECCTALKKHAFCPAGQGVLF